MGPGRKAQERERRRERLLEAAAQVFARKPFDEATMQEVAAEARVGMQGLYEHFPSKQALYEEVMLQRARTWKLRAEAITRERMPPLDRLRALATAYVAQFQDHPSTLPTFVRDRTLFDWGLDSRFAPRFRSFYEEEMARLREVLGAAVAAGCLRDLDLSFLTELCMDVLQASLHYAHRHHPGDVESCVNRALDCLLNGVGLRA